MSEPKGIGGDEPIKPPELESIQPKEGPSEGENIEGLLHAKVRTLGELKNAMIKYLGEKEGKKLYNQFMKSIAIQILNQVQQSASQAKKAAKQMKGNVQ